MNNLRILLLLSCMCSPGKKKRLRISLTAISIISVNISIIKEQKSEQNAQCTFGMFCMGKATQEIWGTLIRWRILYQVPEQWSFTPNMLIKHHTTYGCTWFVCTVLYLIDLQKVRAQSEFYSKGRTCVRMCTRTHTHYHKKNCNRILQLFQWLPSLSHTQLRALIHDKLSHLIHDKSSEGQIEMRKLREKRRPRKRRKGEGH